MKVPLRITTRKLSLSEVALQTIKNKAEKLEQFYDKIIACKVMVETPHRHKNHGSEYHVSIDISVPGAELAVKRGSHEDVYIAIRDAFDAARRQLLNYIRKRQDKSSKSRVEDLYTNEENKENLEPELSEWNSRYDLDYA